MDSGSLDFVANFSLKFGKSPDQSVLLREHAHFNVGGKADYFFSPSTLSDLIQAVLIAKESNIPHFIMGGGYNLLFDDEGFRGMIIKNCVKGMAKKEAPKIDVLSGTPLPELVQFCVDHSLTGFEFLAGIPGTVGGAVFGNAGAFDGAIGSYLTEALVLDREGNQICVDQEYFDFDYRQSRLRASKDLLLRATFVLKEGDGQQIRAKIDENLAKREKKHPPKGAACAGSFFKNPALPDGKRMPAAALLDKVGAKNLSVGGASVFSGHANFIVNRQAATAKDILNLAQELKNRVRGKFGILLEEEVIYLPADPPWL
jgi:UDP-N-acetylmuramate dehydrogenase